MVTGGQRKRTDRHQAQKYHKVARAMLGGASLLVELASEDDTYGNAIAVLATEAARLRQESSMSHRDTEAQR